MRVVNPTPYAINFDTTARSVNAQVPGGGAVYGGLVAVSQGSLNQQPAAGGTGNVRWRVGSVAANTTAYLTYHIDVTPASAGQRISVTGAPGNNGTRGQFIDETGNSSQARAITRYRPPL